MHPDSITPGLLAEAARQPVKAGGLVTLPGSPAQVRMASFGGTVLPYDVIPALGSKHAIKLQCEAHLARTVSLCFSYRPGITGETTPSVPLEAGGIPIPTPRPPRHHAAVISFGVGGALHVVEVDVTEGTVITIPSQVVEVAFCHYGTEAIDPLAPDVQLQSQASTAYGPAVASRAVKTQRALMPLGLFPADLSAVDVFADVDENGLQNVPLLRDAQSNEDAEDAFLGALAAAHDSGTRRGAYQNALDRVSAVLPPAGEGA